MEETTDTMLKRMVKRIAEDLTNPTSADWYIEWMKENNDPDDIELYEKEELDLEDLETPGASDYVDLNVYDIRYIVNSNLDYIGAELMVAGGGPTIWVSTVGFNVEGYWGGKEERWGFSDELELDEYLADYYDIIRRA